jgi:acyl dehydratase
MTAHEISLDQYKQLVGQQIGASRWFLIDQQRITRFAELTEDEQFIHVDPEAAARTRFGGTVAHGFLSLSLLSAMAASAIPAIAGAVMTINYGFNSLRFLKPVCSGQRVRGSFVLKDLKERAPGQWLSTFAVDVQIELEDKPALTADWLTLNLLSQPMAPTPTAGTCQATT